MLLDLCLLLVIDVHLKTHEMTTMSTNYRKTNNRQGGSNTALAAVAFQDHMMRNLSLSDPLKKKQIHHGVPKKHLKEVKSVVDSGVRQGGTKKKEASSGAEREYVLDQKPQPMTLAQRLGLVEVPDQPLSDLDWRDAKNKSNRRDDSDLPCVICKEEFGLQQQVLLSCSHVFHRNCLQAFERFTGKKTCPMCRKEQYQTRVIHEGAKLHRVKCATRIQACWRGYVVHSWYRKLRQTVPPKDPRLRKKFYEEKLQMITERLLRSFDTQVDAFLAEMDRSITASRDVFKHLEASSLRTITPEEWDDIQLKAVERGKTECPICIMPLHSQDSCLDFPGSDEPNQKHSDATRQTRQTTHGDEPSNKQDGALKPPRKRSSRSHGTRTKQPDIRRPSQRTIESTDKKHPESEGEAARGDTQTQRQTVLLSCTHVFHRVCLEAFEELALAQTKVCPVCRAGYQKRAL